MNTLLNIESGLRWRRRIALTITLTTLLVSGSTLIFAIDDPNPPFRPVELRRNSPSECKTELAQQLALISIHANDPLLENNRDLANRCGAFLVSEYEQLTALQSQQRERGVNIGPIQGLINFETPHVHPIDLTPDGNTLISVNTAAHRLDIWQVNGSSLTAAGSIPVGLDPVSVRARTDNEVWVVNQISDSISVVNLALQTVTHTLSTDNEPADVVFAGPSRAFVTASEANAVNVFDVDNLEISPQKIAINGEDPRALAVSADGQSVFAAIFESGNGTRQTGGFGGGGTIVRDNLQTDNDVAIINVNSLSVSYRRRLMNMVMAIAVQPDTQEVFVVGTEAFNDIPNEPALNGQFVKVHMASFTGSGLNGTTITDLNPHLDYTSPTVSSSDRQLSIGDPRGIAWRSNSQHAFITGMGSNNVVVVDGSGNRVDNIEVGQGPTGIVIKDSANLGFVMNKFSGSISVVDLNSRTEISEVTFDDPTPASIKAGRPILYDTHLTSGTGHLSCASCHVDGRTDRLGWQLSDGLGTLSTVPQASNSLPGNVIGSVTISSNKQVMTTQTLLDIMEHPRFHWRGDRETIDDFNGTFVNLMGRNSLITQAQMDDFKAYLRTLWLPPNPYRNLDNSRPQTVTLPDGSTVTSTRVGSNTTDALRGGGNNNNCLICHSGQGNATRNFGANAEISSNIIAPALPALYDKMGFSFNRTGFGFFHHGGADLFEATRTREFLAEILTLEGPDGPLVGDEIRQAPHAGMGRQVTISGTVSGAENVLLNQLIAIANGSTWAELIAHTRAGGLQRGYALASNELFNADITGETETKAGLLAMATTGNPVTFTLVAAGMSTRLALDSDLDGNRNNDNIDTDGDGIINTVDPDDDNDGTDDINDAFPLDASEQTDTDADGIGNNADEDDDNDGVNDGNDTFPLDSSESSDIDGDGLGDNTDTDDDNDGIPDITEGTTGSNLNTLIRTQLGASQNSFDNASDGQWVAVSKIEYDALATARADIARFGTAESNIVTGTLGQWGSGQVWTFGHNINPSAENIHLLAFKRGTGTAISGGNDQIRLSSNSNGTGFNPVGGALPNGSIDNGQEHFVLKGSDQSSFDSQQFLGLSTDNTNPIRYQATGQTGGYIQGASPNPTTFQGFGWSMQGLSINTNSVGNGDPDADGDGVLNAFDLDSDNDSIPDVVEAGLTDANGDFVVDDLVNEQGSVTNPPDSDGDGTPDYLDLESTNAANDGTAFDIQTGSFASLDTNGDGQINGQDTGGGQDANSNGVDDLVENRANNTPPVLTSPGNQITTLGATVSLAINASDGDGDNLSFSANGLPAGLSIDSASGLISGITNVTATTNVTVTVQDGHGGSGTVSFTWTVNAIGSTEIVAHYQGDFRNTSPAPGWQYYWNAQGPIGQADQYVAMLSNGSFYDSDGTSGLPDATDLAYGSMKQRGGHPGRGISQGQSDDRYVIAAFTVNRVGEYRIVQSEIIDSGCTRNGGVVELYVNDTLIQQSTYGPVTTSFNSVVGNLVAGDTVYVAVGPNGSDGCDGFIWDYKLEVSEVSGNSSPVLVNPGNQSATIGNSTNQTISASDSDGDALQFSATGLPAGLSIDGGSGLISGILTTPGSYNVSVSVSDGQGGNDSVSFTWTVNATSAEIIAHYQGDYRDTSPAPGWQYYWNSQGPIGQSSQYTAMLSNGSFYDSDGTPGLPDATDLAYGSMKKRGGHPGRGISQGQTNDRYVIAAFTVNRAGDYRIVQSEIIDSGCTRNGGVIELYTNDSLIQQSTYGPVMASFDISVGSLVAGDTVYVAVGPDGTDGCDGFLWDYKLEVSS